MYKYFTYANTYRYIDILNDLIQAYNYSKHRTIKMAPADLNSTNILLAQYVG